MLGSLTLQAGKSEVGFVSGAEISWYTINSQSNVVWEVI